MKTESLRINPAKEADPEGSRRATMSTAVLSPAAPSGIISGSSRRYSPRRSRINRWSLSPDEASV
jgi:hypothetical protein